MTAESRLRRKNNRALLREWKMENVPEFRARVERDPGLRLNPTTGRELRFKRYADRHLLVMTGGDQHDPELEWIHYDEIADRNRSRDWISRIMTAKFGLDADLEQRCWYTGGLMYFVPYELRDKLKRRIPWECSREHLVSDYNGDLVHGTHNHGASNVVLAGRYFNAKIGHNPLPLKVLTRQEFMKIDFDRDRPTWAAMRPILDAKIAIENQHRLGSHYPWQPWAFDAGTRERRMADAFHKEMMDEEREFLALDAEGRADWIKNFTWRW